MSKRKSSQQLIDTIVKLSIDLRSEIINQLEAFEPSKNKNLLEELKELLEFKDKRKKYSDFYLEISIYQIENIVDLLIKFDGYYQLKNPSDNLKSKLNQMKEEIFDELILLRSKLYVESNIDEDTNLNYDFCDIINDEPINKSNYNNESIDPKINKLTNEKTINNESNYNNEPINNEPINKSTNEKTINKSSNNDKIIEDLFPLVFKYLSINDLINCRLVNKQFKYFSDNTNGINKLIIGEPGLFEDYNWFYNNTEIEDEDLISLKCFRTIQLLSIFNLDKNLKYLKIYDSQFKLTEISNLINLESVELDHYNDNNNKEFINLNNLKFLALNDQDVQLTTPKLKKIQFNDINRIKLIGKSQSIKHLITKNYNCKLKMFKNLEIIELRNMESKTLNGNLLIIFKNLEQLKINLNFTYVKYSDKTIEKILIKILTDKIKLKKEIDIYLEGIKIENIDKFNELINIDQYSYWKFALDNYDLLDSNISFIGTLNYCDLEECFNNPINDLPTCFFGKFNCIQKICTFNTKDVDGLKWFIINLKHLTSLTIGPGVSLGQHFYDHGLPNTIKCLYTYTEEDINYKFILKLSKLTKLNTFIDKDLFDLAFTSFLNLKYLKYFRFHFNEKKIAIKKEDDYFYLNQIRTKLEYNQLIEECNKIRSK